MWRKKCALLFVFFFILGCDSIHCQPCQWHEESEKRQSIEIIFIRSHSKYNYIVHWKWQNIFIMIKCISRSIYVIVDRLKFVNEIARNAWQMTDEFHPIEQRIIIRLCMYVSRSDDGLCIKKNDIYIWNGPNFGMNVNSKMSGPHSSFLGSKQFWRRNLRHIATFKMFSWKRIVLLWHNDCIVIASLSDDARWRITVPFHSNALYIV